MEEERARKSGMVRSVLEWVRNPPSFPSFVKTRKKSEGNQAANMENRVARRGDRDRKGGKEDRDRDRDRDRETTDYYGFQRLEPSTGTGVRRRETERDEAGAAGERGGQYQSSHKRTRYSPGGQDQDIVSRQAPSPFSLSKRREGLPILLSPTSSPFRQALARSEAHGRAAIDRGSPRFEYVTSPPRSPLFSPDFGYLSPAAAAPPHYHHGNAESRRRLSLGPFSGNVVGEREKLSSFNSALGISNNNNSFGRRDSYSPYSPYAASMNRSSPYRSGLGLYSQGRSRREEEEEEEEEQLEMALSPVYSNVARRAYKSANASQHLIERGRRRMNRSPSHSLSPSRSPSQMPMPRHYSGAGAGYAPSPKEEKILDLEEAAKLKEEAELLYKKTIRLTKLAYESSQWGGNVTNAAATRGAGMSRSPRQDYEDRKAFMKPELMTLDVKSLSSYKKLIDTVNSIEEEPFAASPFKASTAVGQTVVKKEKEEGDTNSRSRLDRDSTRQTTASNEAGASGSVVGVPSASARAPSTSKPLTLLQLKIQRLLGKQSLEEAVEKERQIEIDSLHTKLDTLELTRVKGDIDAVEALLSQEEEEEKKKKEKAQEGRVVIKPLSPESKELYRKIMSTNHGEVISQHKALRLTVADMHSLGPGQWLTDENINFYMALLNDRAQRRIKEDRGPACYFANTFFFNKLYKNSKRYEYKGVKKWTKKVKIGVNTAECDKIIVPIHQNVHWCCAVVDMKWKELVYYDSMLGRDESVLESLAKWVEDEMKDKADLNVDTSTWARRYPNDIPTQENGYDCGVFAVKFAEYSGLDAPLDFSQKNMPLFRKQMVVQLAKVNLDFED